MNQVAIVTGATKPRGLGRAIAIAFAKAGVDVAVSGRPKSREGLEATAAAVEELGVRSHLLLADTTDPQAILAGVAGTIDELGSVDYLVNNAGVGVGSAVFLENDERSWDFNWAVNVKGTVAFCEAVLPHMAERGSGSIVNISSMAGIGANPGMPYPYTATKHAIVGLTKQLALEYGPSGIRANVIAPGAINTDMLQVAYEAIAEAEGITVVEAAEMENAGIALRRPAEPEEIAEVVVGVAMSGGAYLTGIAIPVSGGMMPGL
ncbi:MAG: SDR family NAD(P)-dependent oxidoreductase [Acidimicrobiia bacterium]|nr:SDR family NAD(P)-dependent oxidoreductase [Acidimicrobiia bacterium]